MQRNGSIKSLPCSGLLLPLYELMKFGTLQKLPHGCPKWADTKVTSSRVSKMGGGSRPLLDNVQKKDAFLWLPLPYILPFKEPDRSLCHR